MSFVRLARESGAHYLEDYRSVRFSPVYDHLLEVQAGVTSLDTKKKPERGPINVPLSDFATYPIGSTFGIAGKRIKAGGKPVRSRRLLQFTGQREVWTVERTLVVPPFKGRVGGPLAWDQPVLVLLAHDQSGKEIGVSASGLFQFHCAAFSQLLDTLSVAWRDPESAIHTFFADTEVTDLQADGTLVMSPARAFLSNAKLLELTLLITEPSLRDYLIANFRALHAQLIGHGAATFADVCPADPIDCTIRSEVVEVALEDGELRQVEFCDRVIADHRQPRFDRVVVRLPLSEVDEQIKDLADLGGLEPPPRQGEFDDKTEVSRNPHTSRKSIRIEKMSADFGKLMPGFRQIPVRKEYKRTPHPKDNPSPPPENSKKEKVPLPEVSVAPPTGGSGVPNVRHVGTPISLRPLPRPTSPESFLADSDDPGLSMVQVEFDRLPTHMIEFLHATYRLYDRVAHDALPPHSIVRGQERLFVVPPEWGRFARCGPGEVPRMVAAVPLRLDGGVVWVVEIMRWRPSDTFSTGFCLSRSQEDGLVFLGRLLRSVSRRFSTMRGDDPHGTWPHTDFADVSLDSLRHSSAPGRKNSLSEILLSRAMSLLAPKNGF